MPRALALCSSAVVHSLTCARPQRGLRGHPAAWPCLAVHRAWREAACVQVQPVILCCWLSPATGMHGAAGSCPREAHRGQASRLIARLQAELQAMRPGCRPWGRANIRAPARRLVSASVEHLHHAARAAVQVVQVDCLDGVDHHGAGGACAASRTGCPACASRCTGTRSRRSRPCALHAPPTARTGGQPGRGEPLLAVS